MTMATSKKNTKSEETKPKVQNAFEAYFSARKQAEETPKEKPKAVDKEALRDTRITKVCATCGKDYHPTRNGYSQVSKYCSQKCAMNTLRGKFSIT
jgi:hypothetical protein